MIRFCCRVLPVFVWIILACSTVLQQPLRGQQDLPTEVLAYADWVLYNGKVLTADDQFTIAQAVAVRDGKILAVGETARILKMAGPNTKKVDLQGKTVTPGYYDTHFHLHSYVLTDLKRPGIRWGDTVEGGQKELAKFVEKAKDVRSHRTSKA